MLVRHLKDGEFLFTQNSRNTRNTFLAVAFESFSIHSVENG